MSSQYRVVPGEVPVLQDGVVVNVRSTSELQTELLLTVQPPDDGSLDSNGTCFCQICNAQLKLKGKNVGGASSLDPVRQHAASTGHSEKLLVSTPSDICHASKHIYIC
jgi:hypothetical protein